MDANTEDPDTTDRCELEYSDMPIVSHLWERAMCYASSKDHAHARRGLLTIAEVFSANAAYTANAKSAVEFHFLAEILLDMRAHT